jgi:hypothetical protein
MTDVEPRHAAGRVKVGIIGGIAVIMNYLKRSQTWGTWLESR